MRVIRGKRALVTGAASGIGRAIALALAREGADVYLLDIDETKLAAVIEEAGQYGTQVLGARCDLARPEQITAAVEKLLRTWGHLDILVNNAGVSYHGKTERMTAAQWNLLLGVNLLAPIQLTRELLPTLLAREEAHVLNVCSILGLVTIAKSAAYQASKFGLVGFTESLRAEYTCEGLGVTALCPGYVRTNIYDSLLKGSNRMPSPPKWFYASPEQAAAQAVKAIYKNQGMVLVTRLARFLWLVKRLAPRLWAFAVRLRKKKRPKPAAATAAKAA